ncbi:MULTISPECIES: F0F1 ATP synthase subunit B [unclassified Paenibacillus]|uniref:F0F1 ATP synthase subunit B n=1 Tax=unclassified Paenibacillus TaxID=185978 RepID=UPI002406354C|nr:MULTISPECIES: F0F1 ATP synthase subunit B [unclassified Paenibacillus]MDF9840098.1 F-type H+-transporting ATPase subunit b [Paenibacillus sp. PastF-2]MDF9846680.1 F-type H+-transporting ATPase subunit b [Paenibacillus sp. PastM-2]MDF9852971.1 F-type H+-transporting ATPase subunit b [Paenibacillus sp. PastF-1]MDH6478524.1 F-type H+-transporting ATPase subunit b [Paenibacillus sp. PastH-2]MDH6505978.1 F-type H+-transporting ATPase subunit b [Paenibacillus sp. PastM-3]
MTIVWTNIVFSIVAFVILYILLSKYAFSKLFGIMEKRRELVLQQMDEAAKTREQAVAYVEEQKQALQKAREEAKQIIQQSQATSLNQADKLIDQAKVEAARLKDEAVRDIANEKNKAVEALRSELGSASVRIASKLLEKEVKAEGEQEQLVDQYLKEVGGRS